MPGRDVGDIVVKCKEVRDWQKVEKECRWWGEVCWGVCGSYQRMQKQDRVAIEVILWVNMGISLSG